MKKLAVVVGLSLVLAGCGGGEEGEEAEREAAGTECAAAPAALGDEPQLPEGFPTPEGVTYTGDREAGPSRIVEGYWETEIEDAYEGYKDAFEEAGYEVTDDEREEVDAEVNFAGGGSTGQVKLIQECRDRTSVSITARPE